MLSWHKLASMSFTTSQGKLVEISPNRELVQGGGVCAVHDIQLSQFPREELTELTEPVSVFEFDWSSPALTDHPQHHIVPSKVKASGIAQVIRARQPDCGVRRHRSHYFITRSRFHICVKCTLFCSCSL